MPSFFAGRCSFENAMVGFDSGPDDPVVNSTGDIKQIRFGTVKYWVPAAAMASTGTARKDA